MPNAGFNDGFDNLDRDEWVPSGHAIDGSWINTAWSSGNATTNNGQLRLELNDDDRSGKSYTGAELRSEDSYGYGRYDVTMKASPETGVVSTFFLYKGLADGRTNEIDLEFTGKNNNEVHLAFHNSGYHWSKDVALPFSSSDGMHKYTIDWQPGKISFFADGKLLESVTDSHVPTFESQAFLNVWTGLENWLGKPNFSETAATYDSVSYTPMGSSPAPTGDLTVALYDANSGAFISDLHDGTVIDAKYADVPLAVRVTPTGGLATETESVTFDLGGDASAKSTESILPYSLFGDDGGVLDGKVLGSGAFNLSVAAHADDGGQGATLATDDIDFQIGSELQLFLVDANNDQVIREIKDGDSIDSATLPTRNLSIRADIDGAQSVKLDIDGPVDHTQTENLVPYALFGDDTQGDLAGRTFSDGDYSLDASAFSDRHGGGTLIASETVDFAIV